MLQDKDGKTRGVDWVRNEVNHAPSRSHAAGRIHTDRESDCHRREAEDRKSIVRNWQAGPRTYRRVAS